MSKVTMPFSSSSSPQRFSITDPLGDSTGTGAFGSCPGGNGGRLGRSRYKGIGSHCFCLSSFGVMVELPNDSCSFPANDWQLAARPIYHRLEPVQAGIFPTLALSISVSDLSGILGMKTIDYDNLKCYVCGIPVPRPPHNLTFEGAAKRTCLECRSKIKAKNGGATRRRLAGIEVTPQMRQVILGSLLGDGGFERPPPRSINWGLALKHALSQEAYLRWKADLLGPLVGTIDHPKERVRARTVRHPVFTQLASILVPGDRKLVLPEVFDELGPLGLAIWYLDDGCLSQPFRKEGKTPRSAQIRIATCAFSREENAYLRDLVHRLTGVTVTNCIWNNPRNPGVPYEGLRISTKHIPVFLDYIREAARGCGLEYKLHLKVA